MTDWYQTEMDDDAVFGQHRYQKDGKTGCDEVLADVRKALADAGIRNVTVTLERYEQKP